jgi:carboxypeptidase T
MIKSKNRNPGESFFIHLKNTLSKNCIKKVALMAVILSLFIIPFWAQDYWDTQIISIEKNRATLCRLREMNLDFLMQRDNRVYIIIGIDDLPRLDQENIPYIMETHNFYPYVRAGRSTRGGVNGDFHSYVELEQDLFALEDSYPQIASLSIIGESLEGRNIYALKISDNVHLDESEAEVIFIGCHHAREWISVEIPFLFAQYLVENYSTDAQIKDLVDQSEIWIVPLLNPDGLQYSIHFYRYWRKNRRDNGDGTYGVDLNRNYDYMWGYDDEGSSPYTDSDVYRGPSAFSEPETRAIRELFAQRNFQALISFHSYSQVILYPWGYTDQPAPDDALLDQIAAEMSSRIQAVNGTFYDYGQAGESFYLTNGDTTDWSYGVYGIPSYTIELPPIDYLNGGFFNAEEEIQPIFDDNLPAMLYLIDWSLQNSSPPQDPPGIIRRIPGRIGGIATLSPGRRAVHISSLRQPISESKTLKKEDSGTKTMEVVSRKQVSKGQKQKRK